MTLINRDLVELKAQTSSAAETSNEEEMTAKELVKFLADTSPDKELTALDGHSLAMVYKSSGPDRR